MQDYKIRRDVTGEVYVGAYAENHPQRLLLTQKQPSVRKGLELLGWDKKRIDAEIGKYQVYVPSTLIPVHDAPVVGVTIGKKIPKSDEPATVPMPIKSMSAGEEELPSPAHEPEPAQEPAQADDPSEGEELPLSSASDEMPSPDDIKEMSRDELEEIAIRFDLIDKIKGTGSGGYRTMKDFKKFLIQWAEQQ